MQVAHKLAPALRPAISKSAGPADYRVRVKDQQAFRQWLQEKKLFPALRQTTRDQQILLLSDVGEQQLQLLLTCPWVTYIDRPNRKAREELELRDADPVANNIPALHRHAPALTGQGMAVSIKENPFDPHDLDLQGRIMPPEALGNQYSVHATTMATLVAGAGNSGPKGKGVATHARLAFSDFKELLPDDSQALLATGISVQNHSYGVGVENYYGLETNAYDKQTYQHPQLLHVFSSGNNGNQADSVGPYAQITGFANLTGQFKTSKNTLSVGALEPDKQVGRLSSKGPTFDGRIKPELVAHGLGGTSEAAAVVSGVALLVQQAYMQKMQQLPPAALVKAALINSADDAARPGPDFAAGFGNADALGAVRSVQEQRFFTGTVLQGQQQVYTIEVPAGARELKASLVWHDPAAEPGAAKALINDLDLTIRHGASSASWRPWILSSFPHPDSLQRQARRGVDRLNNVEQVTLAELQPGTYQLIVAGYHIPQGPQEFSLVYEYAPAAEWLFPVAGTHIEAGSITRIRWQGVPPHKDVRLEYQLAGSSIWHLIGEHIADTSYDWHSPDTMTVAALRLVTADEVITSEEFLLARQLRPQVGFNCANKVMLHWPALPGVQQYQLYTLGSTHLQPLLTVADTLAVLDKQAQPGLSRYLAVAPLLAGMPAQNSPSLAYDSQGVDCYIKHFLPDQFVMDTVTLRVTLSSLYRLSSLSLEKLENGKYSTVQTQAPVLQLGYSFTDLSPRPGSNFYRIKVTDQEGQTFYSQTEEVIYAPAAFVKAYPNPVTAGSPLHVAIGSYTVQLQLFDPMGRLIYTSEEDGVVKQIETKGLPGGLYVIRLRTDRGNYVSTKVLIL